MTDLIGDADLRRVLATERGDVLRDAWLGKGTCAAASATGRERRRSAVLRKRSGRPALLGAFASSWAWWPAGDTTTGPTL